MKTRTKITYRTANDTTNTICGYVMAEDCGEYYVISQNAHKRCLFIRKIVGTGGLLFDADKPVVVAKIQGGIYHCLAYYPGLGV